MDSRAEPIVVERVLKAPLSAVWKAISDVGTMRKWYFNVSDFKPKPGFRFQFTAVGEDGIKQFVHLCEVKEVIPYKKLSYSWRYEGYPGDTLVCFELFDEGHATRLKLTHTGLGTFPADAPELDRKNFVAGWTEIIGNMLPKFLQSQGYA